MMQRHFAV
jgi:hypothetical protein